MQVVLQSLNQISSTTSQKTFYGNTFGSFFVGSILVREVVDVVRNNSYACLDNGHGTVCNVCMVAGVMHGHWEGCMSSGKVRHQRLDEANGLWMGTSSSL